MNYSAISVRYSKALYQLAKEKNKLDDVYKDIQMARSLFSEVNEFKGIIESPIVPTQKKISIIKEIFEKKINSITYNFFVLILQNKRDKYLPIILRNVEDLYKAEKGIKTVQLTTAIQLNKKLIAEIKELVKEKLNVVPEFEEEIDPDIIGGFVLRIGDKQLDGSISTKLRKFKKEIIR